ncbi:MAG: DUF4920 domain-containing protein [Lewinellaceae bacterium]|nr:DUF4920 domain-containing protein [Lewinellaceae bacterium]
MLKNVFVLLSLVAVLASCTDRSPKSITAEGDQIFGAEVSADNAMSYDDLVTQMADKDSMPAKVMAKVGEVCQMKGCWMTLVSDKEDAPEMRVTFKDYGFFVPKDLGGKKVIIDGYAYVETTSVEDLRHYAEDGGKSKEEIEAITEPKEEMAFEATGVRILNQ